MKRVVVLVIVLLLPIGNAHAQCGVPGCEAATAYVSSAKATARAVITENAPTPEPTVPPTSTPTPTPTSTPTLMPTSTPTPTPTNTRSPVFVNGYYCRMQEEGWVCLQDTPTPAPTPAPMTGEPAPTGWVLPALILALFFGLLVVFVLLAFRLGWLRLPT